MVFCNVPASYLAAKVTVGGGRFWIPTKPSASFLAPVKTCHPCRLAGSFISGDWADSVAFATGRFFPLSENALRGSQFRTRLRRPTAAKGVKPHSKTGGTGDRADSTSGSDTVGWTRCARVLRGKKV